MCLTVVHVLECSSCTAFGGGGTFVLGDSVCVFVGRVVYVVRCVWFRTGICLGVDGLVCFVGMVCSCIGVCLCSILVRVSICGLLHLCGHRARTWISFSHLWNIT